MYIRVTTMEVRPDGVDDAVRDFRETLPHLRELSGFEGASMLVNRENGKVRVGTYWASREDLESTAEAAKDIRARSVERSKGTNVDVEWFEIAVLEGRAQLPEAA